MNFFFFFFFGGFPRNEVFHHLFWKKFLSKDRNSMDISKDEKFHNPCMGFGKGAFKGKF